MCCNNYLAFLSLFSFLATLQMELENIRRALFPMHAMALLTRPSDLLFESKCTGWEVIGVPLLAYEDHH